ncbi:MAG: thiolase domain-containing protein, partial [Chloroflexi bacterium]|nr:thiolase domain-containing protein [Chloroflexota bacterium]
MNEVAIIGLGMTAVTEHWDSSLRELAAQAIQLALEDAGQPKPSALWVANAYGSTINGQAHLAPLIASAADLRGVEGFRIEAAEASGGAAL